MKLNMRFKRSVSVFLAIVIIMSNLALVTSAEDTLHTSDVYGSSGIVAPTLPSFLGGTSEETETTPVTEAPTEPEATETTPVTEPEETATVPAEPTFAEKLLATQTLQELHDAMMADPQANYALTAEELTAVKTHAEQMYAAIAEPTQDDQDYYALIIETVEVLAGELELAGDPEVLLDTLPAFEITINGTTYSGVETENAFNLNGRNSGGAYQTYIESLIDADIALIEWRAMGNTDGEFSCNIGGIEATGYDDVYNAIYDLLLSVDVKYDIGYDGSSYQDCPSNAATASNVIWKIKGEVTLSGTSSTSSVGRRLIIAEESATILFDTSGTMTMTGNNASVIIQGRDSQNTITFKAANTTRRDGNTISVTGGSLYLQNVKIDGFNFNSRSAIRFNSGNYISKLYMTDSGISNVSGDEAPGILAKAYSNSSNSVTHNSKLFINNSTFTNCVTISGSGARLGGSAIRSYAADESTLEVRNCLFEENKVGIGNQAESGVGTGGGAVYWKSVTGSAKLIDCRFINNSSTNVGGAVYSTGTMEIIRCHFEGNTALRHGGAIAVEPPYTGDNYDSITIDETMKGSLTLDSGTKIINNTAKMDGGGIYFYPYPCYIGDRSIDVFTMNLHIDGAEIRDNHADGNGGSVAMNLDYGNLDYRVGITIDEGSVIQANSANNNGGAIWMSSAEDCDCLNNTGVTMYGGTLTANTAINGGAIYIETGKVTANMDFNLIGGTVTNNAASANGGAAYVTGGSFNMSGGSLGKENNSNTAIQGGAVYVNGGNASISGGQISYNVATNNGGGIAVSDGNIVMSGGSVSNNTAQTGSGGGMFVSSSGSHSVSAIIYSGTVSDNTAAVSGGAVGMQGGESSTLSVQIGLNQKHEWEDGKLTPIPHDPYIHESCPVITNNSAGTSGGAFFISGGSSTDLNFFCLTESGNTAIGDIDVNNVQLSDFLMVEGGDVVITTAKDTYTEPTYDDSGLGSSAITGSIHVIGGTLKLYGTMDNPKIESIRTIDLKSDEDEYGDYRGSLDSDASTEEKKKVKVSYHENFYNPDGTIDSTQTALDVEHAGTHVFFTSLYVHAGYELTGWNTMPDGSGTSYPPGQEFTFYYGTNPDNPDEPTNFDTKEHYGDLSLYAIWKVNGYFVDFDPGVPDGETYSGTMSTVTYAYDVEYTLPESQFARPGYIFEHWDLNGTSYQNQAAVINLTTKNGDTVTLVAQWTECSHPEESCTYTADDDTDVITKNCTLCGLSGTATLIAQDAVYDGNSHFASVSFSNEDLFKIASESSDETGGEEDAGESETEETATELPKPTYTGVKIGINAGNPVDDPEQCINAGNYTAALTIGAETVTVNFTISKADQPAPASRPTYTAPGTDGLLTVNELPEGERVSDTSSALVEYIVRYYSNGVQHDIVVDDEDTATAGLQYTLTEVLKTYAVLARYAETDNYNASDIVSAELTFVFAGNLNLTIIAEDGIDFWPGDTSTNEMTLFVTLRDSYYLINEIFEFSKEFTEGKESDATYSLDNISILPAPDTNGKYTISATNPDNAVYVTITIGKTKKSPTISVSAKEKQHFSDFEGDESVSISRDSAFTVFYKVTAFDQEVYDTPKLTFAQKDGQDVSNSVNLPVGTTIIMRDRSNGNYYYYKVADSEIDTISLDDFKKMGTSENISFTAKTGNLRLQFVVDFSGAGNPLIGDNLVLSMVVGKKTSNDSAPVIAEQPITINLHEVSCTMTGDDGFKGLSQAITIDFTVGAAASKYDHRDLAMVLVPSSSPVLPIDASISVTVGNTNATYRPNGEGNFVIPLGDFPTVTASTSVHMRLNSKMFPISDETDYVLKASLFLSSSDSEAAPMNGNLLADETLTFTSSGMITSITLKVANDKRLFSKNDSITAVMTTLPNSLPDGYTVEVKLYREFIGADGTGSFGNTALSPTIDEDLCAYTFSLNTFVNGNYCVVAQLLNENEYVVNEARYYFIIHDNTT